MLLTLTTIEYVNELCLSAGTISSRPSVFPVAVIDGRNWFILLLLLPVVILDIAFLFRLLSAKKDRLKLPTEYFADNNYTESNNISANTELFDIKDELFLMKNCSSEVSNRT